MEMPSQQEAFTHLYDNVHARVFLQKLASRGYQPANFKEAQDLLGLGAKIDAAQEDPTVKAAAEGQGRFALANVHLDAELERRGINTGVKSAAAQQEDLSIQNIVGELRQDPAIHNAMITMKSAEADVIGAQLREPKQAMEGKCEKCGMEGDKCKCGNVAGAY